MKFELSNLENTSFDYSFISAFSAAGIYAFWNAPWWKPGGTRLLWQGLPFHPVSPTMTWYYLVQSAYNLDALYSLLELSLSCNGTIHKFPHAHVEQDGPRRLSRNVIHHVVTNLLVIGSSHFRLTRIGSMVFLVHDISDVPVDLSKLANFLKWKRATTICFASMCLLWALFAIGHFAICHLQVRLVWNPISY